MEHIGKLIDTFAEQGGLSGLVILLLFGLVLYLLKTATNERAQTRLSIEKMVDSQNTVSEKHVQAINDQAKATNALTGEQQKLNIYIESLLRDITSKNIKI